MQPIEETLPDQSQTITQPPKDPGPTRIDILKPSEEFDVGYDYDQNYDDDDDEDDDSEDEAIESETVVPEVSGPVFNKPPETIPTTLKIDIEGTYLHGKWHFSKSWKINFSSR